jgi:hypothetical protein
MSRPPPGVSSGGRQHSMVQGGQALLGGDFRAPAPRRGYKVRLSSLARQPKVESLPAGRLRMSEIVGGGGRREEGGEVCFSC